MSVHVPHELVIEILARLPVVSLLRFKTVRKSWYSLITSPSFVSKHFSHSENKQFIRIYEADGKQRYRFYRYDGQCGHECSELELPNRDLFTGFDVVGSCNGLLCIWKNFPKVKSAIIVWNPSTRKSVTLPKPQVGWTFVLGFGANPITHQYKVVRIMVQYPYYNPRQTLVEIYTQGTGSWRRLGSTLPPCCFIRCGASQAFVNGAVNWIAIDASVFVPLIVSFDMSAETFSVMMLPPPLANYKLSLSVQLFRGSLAVLCGQRSAYSIWVMKEYGAPGSWTKLISFEVNQPLSLNKGFGVGENGKVLLSTEDGHGSTKVNRLFSYDTVTKAVTDTQIRGHSFDVGSFMETLVSVENQGGVLDG